MKPIHTWALVAISCSLSLCAAGEAAAQDRVPQSETRAEKSEAVRDSYRAAAIKHKAGEEAVREKDRAAAIKHKAGEEAVRDKYRDAALQHKAKEATARKHHVVPR